MLDTWLPSFASTAPPPSWICDYEMFEIIQSEPHSVRVPSYINSVFDANHDQVTSENIFDEAPRIMDLPSFDKKIIGDLCRYPSLPENWDGEGGEPILIDAVVQALLFLSVIPADVGSPKVMALPTGAVSFYWDRDATYVEISFDGSGNYCAFGKSSGIASLYIDNAVVSDPSGKVGDFPKALREILINT